MENENQKQNLKKNHTSGIVRITPVTKSPEEIEKILQEIHEERFNPFVTVGGRLGNMVFPMDKDD